MDSARRITLWFLLLTICAFTGGCVYYNTFFLAKKNFKKGEAIRKKEGVETAPPNARPFYDKALEKCSKVLTYYENSKYIDDALFLIGLCFLRLGEYDKALRKFSELLANFPESRFADESRYWRGVCLYYVGEEDIATDTLQYLIDQELARAEDAAFMLGELAYQKGDYISALNSFLNYLEKFSSGQYAPKAHLRIGQIEKKFERCDRVIEHLEKINKRDFKPVEYYEVVDILLHCYIDSRQIEMAERLIDDFLSDETYIRWWGDGKLWLGDIAYAKGDTNSAREIWEKVIKDYPKTATSAWAYYRLGDMYFASGDLVKAKEMFDNSAGEVSSGEVRQLALKKSAIISRLLAFRQTLSDSLSANIASAQVALAEMYLLELNSPDSALSAYRYVVEHFGNDTLAPKATYGMGWILAYKKNDYRSADSVFAMLLKSYPEDDHAVGAANYFKSRGTSLDSLGVKNVTYYFIRAEEFWLTYHWLDSAIVYYDKVIANFPDSRWVPMAMCAKAEILSSVYRTDEAKAMYEQIREKYPGTQYDSLASVRLGLSTLIAKQNNKTRKQETIITSKTDTTTASTDTTLTPDKMLPAPRPVQWPLPLYYDERFWKSDLAGRRIRLKLQIDVFGKVTRAEIFQSCGESVIDSAAIISIKHADFKPEELDIRAVQENRWFLLDVPVMKPTMGEPPW